ncbi:MAG: DUF1559 domain-containing protein [Planctomycetota bacterium]
MTLVELLVVVGIVGILAALTLPAVQAARETARRTQCASQVHQWMLAVHNYQSVHRYFPPSFCVQPDQIRSGVGHSWSVHARLMPYLEQVAAAERVDLAVDWHEQVDRGVADVRGAGWLCPSESRDAVRYKNGKRYVAPTSYGFSAGTWHVFSPNGSPAMASRNAANAHHVHTLDGRPREQLRFQRYSGRLHAGDGAFIVNGMLTPAAFLDGLSQTLAIAEVKTYQPYLRNLTTPLPVELPTLDTVRSMRGQFKTTGHTVWPDGRVHHSGVTTAFPPGTRVLFEADGVLWDIDFTTQQEGKSMDKPTYAAITSRSHHPGVVQIARMDGSVSTINLSIDPQIYRAMGTRAGREVADSSL